jgi:hypothetical protein
MKDYDFKGVIQAIKDASPSHLALVSFLVLPVVMHYWLQTLLEAFPGISNCLKVGTLIFLIAVYLTCLVSLAVENEKRKQFERKRDQIVGKLVSNGWTRIKFETAKTALSGSPTDEEISAVIDAFPLVLRHVQLKKKHGGKPVTGPGGEQLYVPGVGLVIADEKAVEEDS